MIFRVSNLCRRYKSVVNLKNENKTTNLTRLIKNEKWYLLGSFGFMTVSSVVTMSIPLVMGKLIDKSTNTNIKSEQFINSIVQNFELNDLTKIAFGCLFIGCVANFGRMYLSNIAGQRMTMKLREKLFKNLMSQDLMVLEKLNTGEMISRINNDADMVGAGLSQNSIKSAKSCCNILLGSSMMVYISPNLTVSSMCILSTIPIFSMFTGVLIGKISKELQARLALSTNKLEGSINGLATVKVFNNENKEIEKYKLLKKSWFKQAKKDIVCRGLAYSFYEMFGYMIIMYIPFRGINLVLSDQLTVGELSSFFMYLFFVGASFSIFSTSYNELNKVRGASETLFELINQLQRNNETKENASCISLDYSQSIGDIEFKNVSFNYPSYPNIAILKDVSLQITQRKHTAIIGSSGSGKSTISHLLLRLYDLNSSSNSSGQILTNHNQSMIDISQFSLVDWRHHVIGVLQNSVLFQGNILDNILYGLEPDSEMRMLAEKIGIGCGLTKLDQEANLLSRGQRQRVLLARCLMRRPDLLILDEATSDLDIDTETKMMQLVRDVLPHTTLLSITHKPSIMKHADWIYMLERGQIKWEGTFEMLKYQNCGQTFNK